MLITEPEELPVFRTDNLRAIEGYSDYTVNEFKNCFIFRVIFRFAVSFFLQNCSFAMGTILALQKVLSEVQP
jgi:hypothetical protein